MQLENTSFEELNLERIFQEIYNFDLISDQFLVSSFF